MTATQDRRGFSLVELLMVIGIIAIAGAVAVPRYATALDRYQADAAARRLILQIEMARQAARTASRAHLLLFDLAAAEVRLYAGRSAASPAVPLLTLSLHDSPYHCALLSAQFGADAELIFDGYGMPDTAGTVILRSGSQTRTLAISAGTGKAVLQ